MPVARGAEVAVTVEAEKLDALGLFLKLLNFAVVRSLLFVFLKKSLLTKFAIHPLRIIFVYNSSDMDKNKFKLTSVPKNLSHQI